MNCESGRIVLERFDNFARQMLVNFAVAGDGLGNPCLGIDVPVVFGSVADEYAAKTLDFLD